MLAAMPRASSDGSRWVSAPRTVNWSAAHCSARVGTRCRVSGWRSMMRLTLRTILRARSCSAASTRIRRLGSFAQQPGAEDADQRRLAGAAEHQHDQAAIAVPPAPAQPFGDLQVQARRRLALAPVPQPDELAKADGRSRRARLPPLRFVRHCGSERRTDHEQAHRTRRADQAVLDVDLAVGVRREGEPCRIAAWCRSAPLAAAPRRARRRCHEFVYPRTSAR